MRMERSYHPLPFTQAHDVLFFTPHGRGCGNGESDTLQSCIISARNYTPWESEEKKIWHWHSSTEYFSPHKNHFARETFSTDAIACGLVDHDTPEIKMGSICPFSRTSFTASNSISIWFFVGREFFSYWFTNSQFTHPFVHRAQTFPDGRVSMDVFAAEDKFFPFSLKAFQRRKYLGQ